MRNRPACSAERLVAHLSATARGDAAVVMLGARPRDGVSGDLREEQENDNRSGDDQSQDQPLRIEVSTCLDHSMHLGGQTLAHDPQALLQL